MSKANKNQFLWIDLEMTGLDVRKEVIIEVACIATDNNFNSLEKYHAIIKQPQSYLDNMDNWNQNQHKSSGLLDEVPHGLDPETVEQDLIKFCEKHYEKGKIILAGNSVHHDRAFIQKYFKNWFSYLHYRILDVSSFKLVFSPFLGVHYNEKKGVHRAVDDISESLEELKFYLSKIELKEK